MSFVRWFFILLEVEDENGVHKGMVMVLLNNQKANNNNTWITDAQSVIKNSPHQAAPEVLIQLHFDVLMQNPHSEYYSRDLDDRSGTLWCLYCCSHSTCIQTEAKV